MIEALQAIMARAQGIYDSPALLRYGPLMPHRDDDIVRIAREALARVREARKP
jgi:hypothetical protein